jgi:hypothetical protein
MSEAHHDQPLPPIRDEGTVTVRADFTYEAKVLGPAPSNTKRRYERRLREDYDRTGRRVSYDRVIDKDGDLYHERVVDAHTGEVLRDVTESLSEHRGRGSARSRNNPQC